jgi:branched-chain amino acid transport system permease protein
MDLPTQVLQLLIAGLSTGGIYALVALGFNVIFKATDAINFAQGEWVMMGGMIAATLVMTAHSPVLLACVAAVAAVVVVGIVSERLTIRPLRTPTPVLITMVSIGLAIATKALVMLTLGKRPMGYAPFSGDTPIRLGGASIHPQTFWILGVTALFMIAVHLFFERSRLGTAMRAAAADPDAAELVGIDVRRATMWSFAIAAGAGALAGVIVTPLTLTSYDHGTFVGFKGFSAAMLGGIGSLFGAMLGGLLLGVLESLAGGLISSKFKDAMAFVVLLLVLFLRPAGILGKPDAGRV